MLWLATESNEHLARQSVRQAPAGRAFSCWFLWGIKDQEIFSFSVPVTCPHQSKGRSALSTKLPALFHKSSRFAIPIVS
jgi:hypothetical protein